LWSEKSIDVFNVRGVAWKERRNLLCEAVTRCKPDLVIVDGIRDLVNDINDGVLAQEVMEELMHLATAHDCCIVCVLHQNKSGEDHNLRGWIGTELMNKAFEVYSCEKLLPQRIFSLEQTLTRKYDIERTMYFEVGDDGLPRQTAVPVEGSSDCKNNGRERLQPLNRERLRTSLVHERVVCLRPLAPVDLLLKVLRPHHTFLASTPSHQTCRPKPPGNSCGDGGPLGRRPAGPHRQSYLAN
jgi:hypothetical protein